MKIRYKVLLALAVLAVLAIFVSVLYSLRITNVSYVGNTRYTEEELNEKIFDKSYSLNPVYCFWESRYGGKKQIPFIQTYDIEFQSWNQISVRIYEKSVVGYVNYKGYRMYFDKDGIVVESSREALEHVVEIEGLSFSHMILHQKLPVEEESIFNFILNLTQMMIKYELPAEKIAFDENNNAAIYIGNIRFNIGKDQYLNEKVARISDLLPETAGLSGTFFMEEVTADTD
ncbi:MAG: cell division protein FtsQ, partial [Lachnospiraceae bacterium]|nr:cell division protein FtsQ [Lachnospiraceae bacterium]